MIDDEATIGDVISRLLFESPYLYFLSLHIPRVGVQVDSATYSLKLDASSGRVTVEVCGDMGNFDPLLIARFERRSLESFVRHASRSVAVAVETGKMGLAVHPTVIRILLRCFERAPYPLDDREELIYPALFGFAAPNTLWESTRTPLRALQFEGNGVSFALSSGFSEPWSFERALIYDEAVSGAGYELMVRAANPAVQGEFVSWVKHIEDTGAQILPGEWLEFDETTVIPGTAIAGFLVVRPSSILGHFPVGEGVAHWHELIPVTKVELELAKRTNVLRVAETLGARSGLDRPKQ